MTAFLWAVLVYAVMHVIVFGVNVYRRCYPQVIKLGLVGLGVWAAVLLG